jgi:predicted HAD superfamily Cof-like phosphohydrolase
MNNSWEKVKDFHIKFNHPTSHIPVELPVERVEKRLLWMQEELDEFRDSVSITEQADAMIDLIYFALGTLVEMGVKPDRLFEIVHSANMRKLFPDGKPRYNSDGKTLKPVTWEDPENELISEINNQLQGNSK